jgi:hypothetical protein
MIRGFGSFSVHHDTRSFFQAASCEWVGSKLAHQRRAHANGTALQGHIEACHSGAVDPSCRACQELKAKLA